MRLSQSNRIFASLMVLGLLLAGWSSIRSQAPTGGDAAADILRSIRKPKVPVSGRTGAPIYIAAQINSSMRMRREQAWAFVQQAWEPVMVQGSKIPAWMTWYEEADIAQLYRELLRKRGNRTATTTAEVEAALN